MSIGNPIIRLPLDLSGTSRTNLTVAEPYTLNPGINRTLIPNKGPYFVKSLKVVDLRDGRRLTMGTDYLPILYIKEASDRSAEEICGGVVIINQNVSANVAVDMQHIGGQFQSFIPIILELLEQVQLDNREISYGDILGRPDLFPPAAHMHDIGDVYGFEYMVAALNQVKEAILLGDRHSHAELIQMINIRHREALDVINQTTGANAARLDDHEADNGNPHNTTKAHVGLGNVENYGMSTVSEAKAEDSSSVDNKYMSPKRVIESIMARARISGDPLKGMIQYSGNAKEPGTFYSNTTTPNGILRLNYDGHFHATQVYEGESRVYSGNNPVPNATALRNGAMSKEDKAKLDNIEDNANNYIHPTFTFTPGAYTRVTVDERGHVIDVGQLRATDVPVLNQNTTGNAATATKLRNAFKINGVNVDGSADVAIPASFPVGSTYIQFPGMPLPATLFGGDWEPIFDSDGVFFRTPGSGASSFGAGVQLDAIQNIKGNIGIVGVGGSINGAFANAGSGEALRQDGDRDIQANFDASRVVRTSTETRPRNITIRVWRRKP